MNLLFLLFSLILGLVQSKLINLKCDDVKKFVDGHNSRRLQLAKGEVSGQPAASKMNKMVWDAELTTKAKNWADKSNYGHNPDKTVPSERFSVGENIYKFSTTNKTFSFDLVKSLISWFSEYENFTFKKLKRSDFDKNKPKIGHYTQMAWSNSIYLGCAISRYNESIKGKNFISFFVVCNYGPAGNVLDQTPYVKGKASRTLTCTAGNTCKQPYGSSCR